MAKRNNIMLGPDELTRYDRQLKISDFGVESQEKLKNAHIAIIGIGGLGCFSSAALVAFEAEAAELEVTTSSVSKKSKVRKLVLEVKKVVDFQLGMRMRSFDGLNTASQPIGFATTSSDEGQSSLELYVQAKYKRFALVWYPLDHSRDLVTKFYGTKIGEQKITTSTLVIGKFFFVDTPKFGVSAGLGGEFTKVRGAVMLGGFKFPTTGGGWTPVFQLGGQYYIGKHLVLGMDYERSNVRLVTTIPGVPDLVSTFESRVAFEIAGRW